MWFVYIIEADSGELYTGITTNPQRRFLEHAEDKKRGARFFRSRKPVRFLYLEEIENRSKATIRERAIKKMKRSDKLKLTEGLQMGGST